MPLMQDSAASIAHYTSDDLKLLLDFFTRAIEVQDRHVERLRGCPTPRSSDSGPVAVGVGRRRSHRGSRRSAVTFISMTSL